MPVVFEYSASHPSGYPQVKRDKSTLLYNECNNAEVRNVYAHLLLREHINEDFTQALSSPLGYELLLKERLLDFILSFKSNDLYRSLEYISIMGLKERKTFKNHGYNVALNYGDQKYPYFNLSIDLALFIKSELQWLVNFLHANNLSRNTLYVYQEDTLYGNSLFKKSYTSDGSMLSTYLQQVQYNIEKQDSYPEKVNRREQEVNKEFFLKLHPLNEMSSEMNEYIQYLSAGINLPSKEKALPEELVLIEAWKTLFQNFDTFYLKKVEPLMDEYVF